jgi:intracellular sulfur oxidation DsrE/DsrF family protein
MKVSKKESKKVAVVVKSEAINGWQKRKQKKESSGRGKHMVEKKTRKKVVVVVKSKAINMW